MQVRELFELGDDDGAAFRPASDHELLDALLATLQVPSFQPYRSLAVQSW